VVAFPRWALSALAVFLGAALVSCSPSTSVDKPVDKAQAELRTVEIRSGTVTMTVELAMSPREQETGLMFRKELKDGRGMLFVYDSDRKLAFWMKNTIIPLSIAYLGSDGIIKVILDMKPLSLEPIESGHYVRYALEAPLGWFERAGLKPGDRFDLSALRSSD